MPRRAASADAAPRAADDRAVEALGALLERQFEAMRAEQRANHEEVLKEIRRIKQPSSFEKLRQNSAGSAVHGSVANVRRPVPPWQEVQRSVKQELLHSGSGRRVVPVVPAEPPKAPPVLALEAAAALESLGPGADASPARERNSMTMETPRGMELKALAKTSQTTILQGSLEIAHEILFDLIGVGCFTRGRNALLGTLLLVLTLQLTCTVVMHIYGHVHPSGFVWANISTIFFMMVAILFIKLIHACAHSKDLHMALNRIELFLHDCEMGLDWKTMSSRESLRAKILWIIGSISFISISIIEERNVALGLHDDEVTDPMYLPLAHSLSHLSCVITCVSFLLSSAVVLKGAWFQCNLLNGLSKTLDCWCSDLLQEPDFASAVSSWNSMQAILKSVGRELGDCFLSLQIVGHLSLITALAGAFSVLFFSEQEVESQVLQVLPMIPLLVLFGLAARLLAEGGALTKKCEDVPAFVNQLGSFDAESARARQYLVQFITDSRPGFIVAGSMLTNGVFFKLMATLATLLSGAMGVILRRYNL